MAVEVQAARQRIIRRPRLTSILDESRAQVRMLIAPAGYGKTTLARQWLGESERRDVWYRGGPASADVAALAAGISEAASELIPDAGKRMRDRLRATGHPEEDVDILAELFAEDVQTWPNDGWLAIDDYHFAIDSAASERFVDLLTQHTPIQMLITSRRRPSWATARRILYGEILEIDRRALAMEDTEARAVLGPNHPHANEIVPRVQGWPAVLGLAALSDGLPGKERAVPSALYDYFAQELLEGLQPSSQSALTELAVFPGLTHDLARRFLGARAATTLADGAKVGALSTGEEGVEFHPLLREFLVARLAEGGAVQVGRAADRAVRILLSARRWDEAFEVLSTLARHQLIPELVAAALDDLLQEGRTQTILQWLDAAHTHEFVDSATDLAEAELAFRQGDWAKAEAMALAAAEGRAHKTLKTRALIRAGHAARLDSRDEAALTWFRQARTTARSDVDLFEALVGEYFAVLELGADEEVSEVVTQLDRVVARRPEMAVRRAMAELVRATRLGGITEALELARVTLPLLSRVKDPLVRSSFLNGCAHLSALSCRYVEALELSSEQLAFTNDYRLDFVVPPTRLVRALAYSGLREFSQALDEIRVARDHPHGRKDLHIAQWSAALRARIALDQGDFESALDHTVQHGVRRGAGPVRSELLAYGYLAAACLKDLDRGVRLSRELESVRGLGVEARALVPCARAIGAIAEDAPSASQAASLAFDAIERTGAYDCFITAVRASPDLLFSVIAVTGEREKVARLLQESNDRRLARLAEVPHDGRRRGPLGALTPREIEVARLIASGHSNRVIGDELFISEATVKVHVRHILEKLGAKTRAEIAARTTATDL